MLFILALPFGRVLVDLKPEYADHFIWINFDIFVLRAILQIVFPDLKLGKDHAVAFGVVYRGAHIKII